MDTIDIANEHAELFRKCVLMTVTSGNENEGPLYIDGKRCCLDCEEPINEKRLEVKPEAVRCVDCQSDHENMMAKK